MRQILIIAAGMALAAPALADEVLLCSDVPGCMQMHRANQQAEMLTDAEFKLKLSAMHQQVDRQEHKHEVEVQKLKAHIDELKVRRTRSEETAKAIVDGQLLPQQIEEYHTLLFGKEVARQLEEIRQEAKVEAFIKAITDEARRKLEMCVPGTCKAEVPQ